MSAHQDTLRLGADLISAGAIVTSLMGWLPPIAAILGIVWYVLQIYGWFEKRYTRAKTQRRRATDAAA